MRSATPSQSSLLCNLQLAVTPSITAAAAAAATADVAPAIATATPTPTPASTSTYCYNSYFSFCSYCSYYYYYHHHDVGDEHAKTATSTSSLLSSSSWSYWNPRHAPTSSSSQSPSASPLLGSSFGKGIRRLTSSSTMPGLSSTMPLDSKSVRGPFGIQGWGERFRASEWIMQGLSGSGLVVSV